MTTSACTRRRWLRPLVGLCALVLLAAPLHAAAENWAEILKTFKDTWEIDGKDSPGLRSKLRAKKRTALKGMRGSKDGRAVPVLLDAHKKQQKFMAALRKQWAERKRKWEKLEPSMRKALEAKAKRSTTGTIPVTPSEKDWIDEQQRLENLYRDITHEEEIADYARKCMARVVNTLEGDEYKRGVKELLKVAGKGYDPLEREFVRLLGHIKGDPVTDALEGYAGDMQPLTAQAALEALGRQNAPRSIDTLLARLDDPRWQLRVAALEGLCFFREARVVEALLERLKKEEGVIQRHYFNALCRIFHESLPATVEAFEGWWAENKAKLIERWARGTFGDPGQDDPPRLTAKSGHGGSTSFYGIKTDSKHIIFVIDVSGSMGEQGGKNEQGKLKVDVAKLELANAIRSLTASDRDERGAASFNVVSYNAQVQVFKSGKMVEATKTNKDKVFKWITKLHADGATNIYDAMIQAFEIINTRKASKQYDRGADTIYMMTDGKPTAGKVLDTMLIRQEIAKINRERKITIHTIGVGQDHDAQFLRQLAIENGGEYISR